MGKALGSAVKAAFVIMTLTALGNALGLARESALAAYFGASSLTDAYKVAYIIPYILLSSVSAAIGTTFIPVYAEFKKNKSREQVLYFLNNVFNTTIFITIILTLAGMLFAPAIVEIVAPGFKGEVHDLTAKLTVFMLPSIVFLALSNLSGGYLQSNNRFAATAFMGIPFNLLIIASIIFPLPRSIEIVAIGSVLGVSIQFLIQIPSMLKSGYRFRPVILNFREEGLKKMFVLTVPVLIGSIFTQIYSVIERVLGSSLNEGSISALDYANKVNGTLGGIFILSVLTVAYPNLSHLAGDMESFKAAVLKVLKIVIYVTLPIMAGLLVLREPVVKILFERGVFSSRETHITATVLGCLSLGVIGTGISGLLTKAFYSLKDTRTPVINEVVSAGINILLSLALVKVWGVVGIALSSAFTSLISCVALLVWLKMKIGFNRNTEIILAILKALCATAVMGLGVYGLSGFYYRHLAEKTSTAVNAAGLVLCAGLGCIIYFLMMCILRVEETGMFFKFVTDKMGLISRLKPGTLLTNQQKMNNTGVKGSYGMDKYAVIMAGGDGTRFWPLSRQQAPKQLLNLIGNDTMINETIRRLHGVIELGNTLVVTGRRQGEAVNRLVINELPRRNILLEPAGRNTSACIAYSAIVLSTRCREGIMCIFPADHYISNEADFRRVLVKACEAAEKTGKLITIGIKPSFPSTGYGYIRHSSNRYEDFNGAYEALGFIEKPDADRARSFVESGEYLWNSGIFVWRLSTILENLARYLPRIYSTITGIKDSLGTKGEQTALEAAYAGIQSISIDYGILERSDDILVIPGEFGWNDIGNWEALQAIIPGDKYGNTVKANYIGIDTQESLIYGSDRLIASIGLNNVIIADTADALLVCAKDKAHEVKGLVEEIKKRGLEQYL